MLSEEFGKDGVIVTLEWTEENSLYLYNVSVSPQLEVTFIGRVGIQLKVPYNSLYNVSVVAVPPCPHQNEIVNKFAGPGLHYSEYQQYYQYMHMYMLYNTEHLMLFVFQCFQLSADIQLPQTSI